MDHQSIYLIIFGVMGSIITVLIGILVTIAHLSRKDQKKANENNSIDHQLIFEKLTVGKGKIGKMGDDILNHADNINNLDKRVNVHGKRLVGIDKDIEIIYKKVE